MDLYEFRRQYVSGGLELDDLESDPITQFEQWFKAFLELDSPDPNAMVLATADAHQQPRQRIVLLKQFDQNGFVFFTNRNSKKGESIAQNPQVSLHFPWHMINRQIIILGRAEKTSPEEDARYFTSRPQGSQWAAWASDQSQPLSSRQELLDKLAAKKAEFPGVIPLPEFWGGYRVVPSQIEFWQGRENRLHDRFVYQLQADNQWQIQRLAP